MAKLSTGAARFWLSQELTPEETIHGLHDGRECDENDVLMVSLETGFMLVDHLGGFAVGTQMRGISLFPPASSINRKQLKRLVGEEYEQRGVALLVFALFLR